MLQFNAIDPLTTSLFGLTCAAVGVCLGWLLRARRGDRLATTVPDPPPIDLPSDWELQIDEAAERYGTQMGDPVYGLMRGTVAKAAARQWMRRSTQASRTDHKGRTRS